MSQTFDDYRNSATLTNNNSTNVLKFTIRSDNKDCIKKCIFELNEMVKRLIKPMKSENRCYHLFDASNSDLINQIEQSCSKNRVTNTWNFPKLTISVNETI